MSETTIVTGKCRLSYPHLAQPRQTDDGQPGKYSCTLLIPKSDTVTLENIKNAQAAAIAEYKKAKGINSMPPKPVTTLHDGDGLKDSGEEYGAECKGCWVLSANTPAAHPPILVGRDKNPILDVEGELYAGCYVRAKLNFAGYNYSGKKGVKAYLNVIQKICDGDPLGNSGNNLDGLDDDFFKGLDVTVDDDWM